MSQGVHKHIKLPPKPAAVPIAYHIQKMEGVKGIEAVCMKRFIPKKEYKLSTRPNRAANKF
jgi:hypothetical protein